MIRYMARSMLVLAVLGSCITGAAQLQTTAAAGTPTLHLTTGRNAAAIAVLGRQQFAIDGTGFRPGEQVVIKATFPLYSGSTLVETRSAGADASGTITNVTMTPPVGARAGRAPVQATGSTSGRRAGGTVYVDYRPSISLNSNTVAAGGSVRVDGQGFVSGTQVRLSLQFATTSGMQTLAQTANVGTGGNFSRWISIPGYARAGVYTVTATDTAGNFHASAALRIGQKAGPKPAPTATATPTPIPQRVAQGTAQVFPGSTLPDRKISVLGTGFPANSHVTVDLTVTLNDGSVRAIVKHPATNYTGTALVAIRVPYKTVPGVYPVTIAGGGTQAATRVQVLPRSAHHKSLGFRSISLWYHTISPGSREVLIVKARPRKKLGIWTHVIFPSGKHDDYYKETGRHGNWKVRFRIPRSGATGPYLAYISIQLWHGSQTTQTFIPFTVT